MDAAVNKTIFKCFRVVETTLERTLDQASELWQNDRSAIGEEIVEV